MKSSYLKRQAGGQSYRLHFYEAGDPSAPAVLCLHGVSRNANDFGFLASYLAARYRVIGVDLVGRGKSDWLDDKTRYNPSTYMGDLEAILDALDVDRVAIVGSSMGGLLGMRLAAGARCRALVLVDVGPFLSGVYSRMIGALLAQNAPCRDRVQLQARLRILMGDPGELSASQWAELLAGSYEYVEDEGWRLAFDPGIAVNYLSAAAGELDLWHCWEKIECPTLTLRARRSKVLSSSLTEQMRQRGSMALSVVEMADCGHCPHLLSVDHVRPIADWLDIHAFDSAPTALKGCTG